MRPGPARDWRAPDPFDGHAGLQVGKTKK